jgi:hypothetical protein
VASDTASVESLFSRADGASELEKMRIMQRLGQMVKYEHTKLYEGLVREVLNNPIEIELDIEGWRVTPLKIVLLVAKEREIYLSLKNGERLTTIVRYPKTEAMVKEFARAIVQGNL